LDLYEGLSDVISGDDAQLRGTTIGTIQNGVLEFDNLIIYSETFKTYNLRVYPDMVLRGLPFLDFTFKNELVTNGEYYYYFPVNIVDCNYGQILEILSGTNFTYCDSCPAGTFSLIKEGNCLGCPEGGNCSSGVLIVIAGYWRIGEIILACTPDQSTCL